MSRKQWRCFHCDEVFHSRRWAAEHFGSDMDAEPACKISGAEGHLVTYIRKLEDDLSQYRFEDSRVLRSIYSFEVDHRQALIRAEESGYAKGVRDMQAVSEGAVKACASLDENGYICEKSAAIIAIRNHDAPAFTGESK